MSTDCKNMVHPFQNDPGTSQRQRGVSDLLSAGIQIDGRNLAALLDFFTQLSRHVNYYNEQMLVSDWQPFFSKSLPFTLAGIARFDKTGLLRQVEKMNTRFNRRPSVTGLNNLFSYIYSNIIKKINAWQKQVSGSSLPLETVLDKRIQNKLARPLKTFITNTNTGTYWLCTRNFNFTPLLDNPVWQLTTTDIIAVNKEFPATGNTRRKQLLALYNDTLSLIPVFLEVIGILGYSAEQSMEQSLLPLKEELKEQHTPHLAVLFAFLKLFQSLQADLNGFTKKHLDYFYRDVLRIQPKEAVPDQVHVVFEIQQQLEKYKLEKGLNLKDGKDNNKAEIYFATDNEIVVNKTQVAEQKTLFLDRQTIKRSAFIEGGETCTDMSVVEGVYMAPDATKANGIDKDFAEGVLPARAALGAHWSKYKDPEHQFLYPYPNARIGFVMASPVLLLNEGKRKITITLKCRLTENLCGQLFPQTGATNPCCSEPAPNPPNPQTTGSNCNSPFTESELAHDIANALGETYYYVNRPLIAEAVKKGASKELKELMEGWLVKTHTKNEPGSAICYCTQKEQLYERLFTNKEFLEEFKGGMPELVKELFKPRKAFSIQFSGEKEWIAPAQGTDIVLAADAANGADRYTLTITTTLAADEDPVTFYNAENLKEELGTTLPAVKIELDDKIKVQVNSNNCKNRSGNCCEKESNSIKQDVSLYHFFRGLKIMNGSKIDVEVCGVRNLVVQNDDNVEDPNSSFRPFGVRPVVGSNFFLGSHEIFIKNWQKIWVNTHWKDKPNLNTHYQFYNYEPFEDGSNTISDASFQYERSVLENGKWRAASAPLLRRLFNEAPSENSICPPPFQGTGTDDKDTYFFSRNSFQNSEYKRFTEIPGTLPPLNIASSYGFLRFTLQGVGFQHDRYAFVVARHMIALAGLIDPVELPNLQNKIKESRLLVIAIQSRIGSIQTEINALQTHIGHARNDLNPQLSGLLTQANNRLQNALDALGVPNIGVAVGHINFVKNTILPNITGELSDISDELDRIEQDSFDVEALLNNDVAGAINFDNPLTPYGLVRLAAELRDRIQYLFDKLKVNEQIKAALPKEPYTPAIKFLSLDYTATADVHDIDMVHLYPYTGTYKTEITAQQPTLLPTYCDEGNLYVGLNNLVPGSNVHILFQLAEATANSETERESVSWYYLENNEWKQLRSGFEILEDDTNGLSTSGIIQFALPANITNENTILTKGLYWIRASIPCKSTSVSEIIALHTQAVKATFTNEATNDKLRLAEPLAAGSVAKLKVADSSVKKITQPYDSFGGRVPESEGHYYTRVSELLRHKNRAIQKTDYELMVLEAFPQIFKVKCINHSYWLDAGKYENDFPMAPGYVLLAIIPDLNQLKAAENFEPRAPVSLLEEVEAYLKKHTSPFVRLKAMNPRYEKVNLCISAKLLPGKDEVYYKAKLAQDIREFLAPWAVGEFDKLTFGQTINRADIIQFLETRDYLDYITGLKMQHESDTSPLVTVNEENINEIAPISPRSILIAGSIDVCINQQDCADWCYCNANKEDCCSNKMEKLNDYCGPSRINTNDVNRPQ